MTPKSGVDEDLNMESVDESINEYKEKNDIEQLLSLNRLYNGNPKPAIRKIKFREITELAYNLDEQYHELLLACYYANRTALAFHKKEWPDIKNYLNDTAFRTELIDRSDYWIHESLVIMKENVGNFLGGEYREELESLIESFDNNE